VPSIIIEGIIPDNLDGFSNEQAYNILDSAITAQLLPVLRNQLGPDTAHTYRRAMGVQALCMEISTKGFPTNQMTIAELDWQLEKEERRARTVLHRFCDAVGFRAINPRSVIDVPELFYDHLNLPVVWEHDRKTGKRKRSGDAKALEKLAVNYPIALPFVNAILTFRSAAKMRGVFKSGLEPVTGNLRCNFSAAGTETGRLSSQQNPFHRGTNAQNITDELRQIVEAPEGYCILNADLKTAESIAVGYISRCVAYIEACESGDLHTAVSKLNWKELPWTGDLALDKDIAEQLFYRHFTYRDMAKKGGHGTNYYGTPPTMAMHMKLPRHIVQEFQDSYFAQFPEIAQWHLEVIARIQTDGYITTAMRRKRQFWGRSSDKATWREAIAYEPQSLVGDVMNDGLIQVQDWFLREVKGTVAGVGHRAGNPAATPILRPIRADLRAQIHDAGVFLIPIDGAAEIARDIQSRLTVPVDFGDLGQMVIPSDLTIGRVWSKKPKKANASRIAKAWGQRGYTPGDDLSWLLEKP